MTISNIIPLLDNKYAKLVFDREITNFSDYQFGGEKVRQWNPKVKFKWYLKDGKDKSSLTFNDIVHVFGAGMDVAVNRKTKDVLDNALTGSIEFLPIDVIGETNNWYLINVLNVIKNAINLEKSEFKLLKNGSRGPLKKAVFCDKNIPNNSIFTFPEKANIMTKGSLLEDIIKENRLTGFNFRKCHVDTDIDSSTATAEVS